MRFVGTESRMVVARRRVGKNEELLNGYGVLVLHDEKVLEIGYTTT